MNVGIGAVATQFLSWEYLFQIFGIVSLQCRSKLKEIAALGAALVEGAALLVGAALQEEAEKLIGASPLYKGLSS